MFGLSKKAKEQKAHLVQLTTDKKHRKVIKFYEILGFKPSHEGMKMDLKYPLYHLDFEFDITKN